ncbi:MAG: ABC transporter ATP-binding protein [Clostridiales bacterium]|nr:ABC transporter ATP-binding protein [Clostridiales bacterium]
MSLIELREVSYSYTSRYQRVDAMIGIDCAFERGKVYAIVGKSGSGKSTLLSLLAGLDLPQSGEVLFEGVPTSRMDLNKYRRECAALIYQNFRLFPLLTVMENIMYPMELMGLGGNAARDKARELAARVSLPETALNRFPGMLSGGEQQRVAIARALTMDRRLILADEPTGNLDTDNGDRIVDLLVALAHEERCCVIIATHDMAILPRMDAVYRMSDGRITPVSGGPEPA